MAQNASILLGDYFENFDREEHLNRLHTKHFKYF